MRRHAHRTIAIALATALVAGLAAQPAEAGILSWLVAGAASACAASQRCSDHAAAAKSAAAERMRYGCDHSVGCRAMAAKAAAERPRLAAAKAGIAGKASELCAHSVACRHLFPSTVAGAGNGDVASSAAGLFEGGRLR